VEIPIQHSFPATKRHEGHVSIALLRLGAQSSMLTKMTDGFRERSGVVFTIPPTYEDGPVIDVEDKCYDCEAVCTRQASA
jgi:hypothetical protein